jgi:hypothetical protein
VTETQTVDLASWLIAVWDEEERLATEAAEEANGPKWYALEYDYEGIAIHSRPVEVSSGSHRTAETIHISRHDPTSVLARIAADRKILARYNAVRTSPLGPDAFANGNAMSRLDELDQVLRLLASPYKGREGWQESWAHE